MLDTDSRIIWPSEMIDSRLPGGYEALDNGQRHAADALENIFSELLDHCSDRTWFGRERRHPVSGLYLWGGVGRGKTFLMDCFFEACPLENKTRLHFHRFMQKVHNARNRHKHERDPLKVIADDWASNRVICFDEFFIDDIADAMILSRLTERLFEDGVILVATSNVAPDDLYAGGLKRDRFLPAIERIKTHCHIEQMADGCDYRLAHIEHGDTYQTPAGPAADEVLGRYFSQLAKHEFPESETVKIQDRKIPIVRHAASVIWFRFQDLCGSNRAAADYIALGREFAVVMVSDVPILDDARVDAARRFVSAIDVFHDRSTTVFITAEAEPESLYQGQRLRLEFERTSSRLHDMQSSDYIGSLRA